MLGATTVTIILLALLIVGQIATVVVLGLYLRRTARNLGSAVGETAVQLRKLEAARRATDREIKALAVRIREDEVETGVEALNRYLLLASRTNGNQH